MSIQYVQGDLLSSSANILVIPVNCVGVAGKGLALQCKERYPDWFVSYQFACQQGLLSVGFPFQHAPIAGRFFLSFPTKSDWRLPSCVQDIEKGLQHLIVGFGPWLVPVYTIAFPRLGCGAGGLSWSQVQPVMERYLNCLPCTTLIYV